MRSGSACEGSPHHISPGKVPLGSRSAADSLASLTGAGLRRWTRIPQPVRRAGAVRFKKLGCSSFRGVVRTYSTGLPRFGGTLGARIGAWRWHEIRSNDSRPSQDGNRSGGGYEIRIGCSANASAVVNPAILVLTRQFVVCPATSADACLGMSREI